MLRYSVGIDISKTSFQACISVIDATGQVSVKRSGTFANNKAGFKELHQWIGKEHKDKTLPRSITMEATGVYYECCALYLHLQGYSVAVVLPNKAKRYIAALGIKTKNDSVDAKALSRMGAEQALERWEPMGTFFYELRELTRHNQSLKELHTSLSNQLEAATCGMYQSKEVVGELKKLISTVERQVEKSAAAVGAHLRSDQKLWHRAGHLISIPGVGELSAAVILAETGGFVLFKSSSQLVSYAGYDVVENQSGAHVGRTKISKKGNGRIRRILHMPALVAVSRKAGVFLELYERTYARHGIKMKSYVAVQKKLLTTMYALWKKEEDFAPDYGSQKEKEKTTSDGEAVFSSRHSRKEEAVPEEPVEESVKKLALSEQG